MTLGNAPHQKPEQSGRTEGSAGEARTATGRDEARPAGQRREGLGRDDLLQQAVSRENMVEAWKHVKANKGSAGVDGLTIEQTVEHLKTHWPLIRSELLNGTYRPQAVRRVEIPKPTGGVRELGVVQAIKRIVKENLKRAVSGARLSHAVSKYSETRPTHASRSLRSSDHFFSHTPEEGLPSPPEA